jgi:hypothetical protein
MAMGEGQPAMDPWGRGRGKGKIEHGDRRDLAAGSDTTTTVGSAEDSGRERRVGWQPRGVAAWGGGHHVWECERKDKGSNIFFHV